MSASPTSNVAEYTVSEISAAVKRSVEDTFAFVRVRGEVGRVSRPASGHVYLDLKDDRAVLSGVMWRGTAQKLKMQPEQGLEVIATGRLTTFPGQSKYQIVIESIEPAGVGALMALLEERKKKLAAEGLFEAERKQAIPFLPRVIGVVTSPSGAVIRDIRHRIEDRFPTHVLVWPVRVQGETSAAEVTAAIEGFNAIEPDGPIPRPDLLIVARGGGSLEDLWSFNEENVARAAAESEIPLISAVGHETDWTLIDYVADERAPTPTAAAERAVPVRADLMAQVDDLARRHRSATVRHLSTLRAAVQSAARALPRLEALVAVPRQRLDMAMGRLESTLSMAALRTRERVARVSDRLRPALIENRTNAARTRLDTAGKGLSGGLRASARMRRQSLTGISARFHPALLARRVADQTERLATRGDRLVPAFARTIARRRERLERASGLLDAFSYQSVLARGFALVRDGEGAPIRRASGVEGGTALAIQFADGDVSAVVVDGADNGARPVPPKTPPARKPPARKPSTARPSGQASLFDE